MSVFEDDYLEINMTFDTLNETILLQSAQIESFMLLQSNLKAEVEKLTEESAIGAIAIQQLADSERELVLYKSKVELLEFCAEESMSHAADKERTLQRAEEECLLLIEEKNVDKVIAQHELRLKDEAIRQQFSELSELKKELDTEKNLSERHKAEILHWKALLSAKSFELEESQEGFTESYKLLERIQSESEEKLLRNMLQLRDKIDQTVSSAIEYENDNKQLIEESETLKETVKRLEAEVSHLKETSKRLKTKLDETVAIILEMGSNLKQKEESLELLISQSADAEKVINQLLTISASKDESFCQLYIQNLEEFKKKDKTIKGLQATLADNAKEITFLRSELQEIIRN